MNKRAGFAPVILIVAIASILIAGGGYAFIRSNKQSRESSDKSVPAVTSTSESATAPVTSTPAADTRVPPAVNIATNVPAAPTSAAPPSVATPAPASAMKVHYALPSLPADKPEYSEPAYYLHFLGFTSVIVTDEWENTNDFMTESYEEVHGIEPFVSGPSVQIVADASVTLTYILDPDERGSSIEIGYGYGNAEGQLMAVRYNDFSLPSGISARFQTTATGITTLKSNQGATGQFAIDIAPAPAVYGAGARDNEGPQITFAEETAGGETTITIDAKDESGVKMIRYSTDGSTFTPYSGPLKINKVAVKVVSAYADDLVGNRSSLYEHVVTD